MSTVKAHIGKVLSIPTRNNEETTRNNEETTRDNEETTRNKWSRLHTGLRVVINCIIVYLGVFRVVIGGLDSFLGV